MKMKQFSVKMSDGTRYDYQAAVLDWSVGKEYLIITDADKRVLLNARHIVSITIKGDGDDS